MKLLKLAAAVAAALMSLTPAVAQTANNLLSDSEVMSTVSASDVAAMMGELGVATQLAPNESGGAPYLVATTGGNGKFVFRFFNCENVAEAAGCPYTIVGAAFPAAGVTYDALNEFNRESVVTTAIGIGEQQIIVLARNIIVYGGHSRELFKGTVYLFLRDVQAFLERKTSAASIAFSPTPDKASKISGIGAAEASEESRSHPGEVDLAIDVSNAIRNTNDVDFAIDYKAPF